MIIALGIRSMIVAAIFLKKSMYLASSMRVFHACSFAFWQHSTTKTGYSACIEISFRSVLKLRRSLNYIYIMSHVWAVVLENLTRLIEVKSSNKFWKKEKKIRQPLTCLSLQLSSLSEKKYSSA